MIKTKNYKSLYEMIKKIAEPPPGGSAGTPAAPAPTGHYSGNFMSGIPEVKKMQEAMQELATEVMRDAVSATMTKNPADTVSQDASGVKKNSKDSFNNFIAEQYVGTLDKSKKGVEWSPDKNVTSFKDKLSSQTNIYDLDAVMNTLKRIGQSKNEFQSDGRWNFRTDNALRNMLGFAYALLQLEGDFGLPNQKFTSKDLQGFQALLSGYEHDDGKVSLSDADKKKRAPIITNYLNNITSLYDNFRRQVTARPEFRNYIEGHQSFDSYSPAGSNPNALTSQDNEIINSQLNPEIKGLNLKTGPLKEKDGVRSVGEVPISALKDKESFDNFVMDVLGYSDTDKFAPLFLNIIKKRLEMA